MIVWLAVAARAASISDGHDGPATSWTLAADTGTAVVHERSQQRVHRGT